MLDLDHELDQSFDTNSAPEPTSKADMAEQPSVSPSDQAGQPDANSTVQPGAPAGSSPQETPGRVDPATSYAPGNAPGNAPAPPQDQGEDARTLAQSAYQRIADEILESTREVCQRLIADGEKALERAKFLETETGQKRQEAQKELDRAKGLRAEAEAFREKSLAAVSEAQKQAQAILDRARTETDGQLSQVKQQASAEAEKMVAEARAMRESAQQELEAQKLYTEAARLKAESNEALSQLRQQMGSLLSSPGRGAPQDRPAPAHAQANHAQPAAQPAPTPAPVPAPATAQWDADLDESGVLVVAATKETTVKPPPAPTVPHGTSQPNQPDEDPTLSRKKAGRWFGQVG